MTGPPVTHASHANELLATGDLVVRQTAADRGTIERAGSLVGAVRWVDVVHDDQALLGLDTMAGRTVGLLLRLADDSAGRGTGPAVLAAMSSHLFAEGCDRIVFAPEVDNAAAIRAADKAGFRAGHTALDRAGTERFVMARSVRPKADGDFRRGGGQLIPVVPSSGPGEPPPWSSLPSPTFIDLDRLCALIAARGPGSPPSIAVESPRLSAVLLALFAGERGAEIVLTRRSWTLSSHRGEISFPGGRVDQGEHPHDAARREAFEEVDLAIDASIIVGELDHIPTVVSRSVIVPVVARLAERPQLRPMTSEVDRILTVPLLDLLSPRTYRSERWNLDWERTVHFFELDDETVWGATGRMLFQLLELVTSLD